MLQFRHFSRAASSLSRVCVLEAERKFKPNERSFEMLVNNFGEPKFQNLERADSKIFEDVYYDSHDTLSKSGIWLRTRNGEWEAKHRHAGDFTSSHFEEFSGRDQVAQLIAEHLPDAQILSDGVSGIDLLARFMTYRQSWQANRVFNIVVDDTDFGHRVGEVELISTCPEGSDTPHKTAVMARLHTQLDAFMETHRWAFPTDKAVGKLAAYFDLEYHKYKA